MLSASLRRICQRARAANLALVPRACHQARRHAGSLRQPGSAAESEYTSGYTSAPIDQNNETQTATVALVGAPNAGKSSLSNAMIEKRVSAVSRKVNTTRACTTGVYTRANRQLILLDTPGLVERAFLPTLGPERRALSTEGWGAAADSDVAVFVVDASRGARYWRHYATIAGQLADVRQKALRRDGRPSRHCILVLNKMDVTRPRVRLLAAQQFFKDHVDNFDSLFCADVFNTSACSGRGVRELRAALLERTTPGQFQVPPGKVHVDDDIDVIRQHVWEKLLHRVHREVPYRCYFENDEFVQLPNGDLFVSEIIRAPSRATALMVIGEGGSVLRWIRESAERSLAEVLATRVRLKLVVGVAKNRNRGP